MTPAQAHAAAVEAAYGVLLFDCGTNDLPAKWHLGAAIHAYLAALREAGWKVVPERPDDRMIRAGSDMLGYERENEKGKGLAAFTWMHMSRAAPTWPPEGAA